MNYFPYVIASILYSLFCGPLTIYAGSTVFVGREIKEADRVSVSKIDHAKWNSLLKQFVDSEGAIDYGGWKSDFDAVTELDTYLNHLSSADIFATDADKRQQLAFWINAYNALTVKGILREYPTSSIRNHTAAMFGYNLWKDLKLRVAGSAYSLDDIEHKILRKMFDPRIHFAIVCASNSCPKLRNEAYAAEDLDEQLTNNAKDFFADETKFKHDPSSPTLQLSSILDWYGEDFGKDDSAKLKAIAPYLPDSARPLAESGQAKVDYLQYDWSLNDQSDPSKGNPKSK